MNHLWPMQDKSINGALLALLKATIRDDGEGLDHVEALLRLRGVPMPAVLPAKSNNAARRGLMATLALGALRDGRKPLTAIVAHVADSRPEIDDRAAYVRTTQALAKLKRKGLVMREGRLWVLAP